MIIHPAYFAPVVQYVLLARSSQVTLEVQDNYQKQTYRNRCYIYGPNGKQLLSVPVLHSKTDGRQKTKEVRLDNSFGWQKNSFKSLEAAYRSSPFFEFYEDEIRPLFEKRYDYLIDLNLETMSVVGDCLGLETTLSETDVYDPEVSIDDHRSLINAKGKKTFDLQPYVQVFKPKHGFLPNLSILDLLFNEGSNALNYLQEQEDLLI